LYFAGQKRRLLVGTYGAGITKYDGKNFTHYTEKEGLGNNNVYNITQDKDGTLWFGTLGGGVTKYDGRFFTNFTVKDGLSDNSVLSTFQDENETLWFGTRNGLNKLSKKNLNGYFSLSEKQQDIEEKNNLRHPILFENYTYEDGFLGIGCTRGAICQDKNGIIWIGTNEKLTAYHPEGDEPDTIPPNIQLTTIDLFNENIRWSDFELKRDTGIVLGNGVEVGNVRFDKTNLWYGLPNNLSLKYSNNFLTFNYIGITQRQSK
jgi:ligand-binding sensor domain-containing protein